MVSDGSWAIPEGSRSRGSPQQERRDELAVFPHLHTSAPAGPLRERAPMPSRLRLAFPAREMPSDMPGSSTLMCARTPRGQSRGKRIGGRRSGGAAGVHSNIRVDDLGGHVPYLLENRGGVTSTFNPKRHSGGSDPEGGGTPWEG